jgi:hypothetical protein
VRAGQLAVVAAAVAWTGFVWIGRIRNALADDELRGAALAGVVALSATFLVLAASALVLLVRWARGRAPTRADRAVVLANLVWAAGVWAVRIVDIALLDDHDAAFVVVHVALGVVSVLLWWWALAVVTEGGSEEIAPAG